MRAKGFTPNDTSEYHPDQTLRVLVGTRTGSGDGYGQQAFFFVDGRYIGTDAKEPSATLKVVAQSDTEVTLAYPLYRQGRPAVLPERRQATVHFQLNNGKLAAARADPAGELGDARTQPPVRAGSARRRVPIVGGVHATHGERG